MYDGYDALKKVRKLSAIQFRLHCNEETHWPLSREYSQVW